MNRSLKAERLYPVGQYANIKLTDEINELPQEVIFHENLINQVRYLQLVNLELGYRKYLELAGRIQTIPLEEQVTYLETEKLNTLDEIKHILFNKEN